MTTNPKRSPWEPVLRPDDTGTLHATYPLYRYRFLLSDGRTIDVLAIRDGSDLRSAVLRQTQAEAIEGVVRMKAPRDD